MDFIIHIRVLCKNSNQLMHPKKNQAFVSASLLAQHPLSCHPTWVLTIISSTAVHVLRVGMLSL